MRAHSEERASFAEKLVARHVRRDAADLQGDDAIVLPVDGTYHFGRAFPPEDLEQLVPTADQVPLHERIVGVTEIRPSCSISNERGWVSGQSIMELFALLRCMQLRR
jgi:hypothetical protein